MFFSFGQFQCLGLDRFIKNEHHYKKGTFHIEFLLYLYSAKPIFSFIINYKYEYIFIYIKYNKKAWVYGNTCQVYANLAVSQTGVSYIKRLFNNICYAYQ